MDLAARALIAARHNRRLNETPSDAVALLARQNEQVREIPKAFHDDETDYRLVEKIFGMKAIRTGRLPSLKRADNIFDQEAGVLLIAGDAFPHRNSNEVRKLIEVAILNRMNHDGTSIANPPGATAEPSSVSSAFFAFTSD